MLKSKWALGSPANYLTPTATAVVLLFGNTAWAQSGAESGDAVEKLPQVIVGGERPKDAPTEREDSYTVRGTSVGTKLPTALKDSPQSISVLTRQRIEDQNLATLDEIVVQAPGITLQPYNTGVIPQFYSRGFPIEYFQFDGVPMQTGIGGGGSASYSQPDMVMYDRVEILRGAAGLFNGAGQPGGVINLVRKRPTAQKQFTGALGIGSWSAKRGELDYSTPLNAAGTLRARGALSYDDRDSFVDYANSRKTSLYGIIEADIGSQTTAAIGIGHQDRSWLPAMLGVPRYSDGSELGLPRSTFLNTPWTYWDFETTQVFADVTHWFNDDWQLKVNLASDRETSDLKYSYVAGAVDPQTLTGPRLAGGANAYENKQIGLDAMLTGGFDAFGRRHEAMLGLNWYDRDADSHGGSLPNFGGTPVDIFNYDPSAIADPGDPVWTSHSRTDMQQHGLYGVTRLKLADPLTLIVGGRMSWWDTSTRNMLTGVQTEDYGESSHFSPYAGVVYALNPQWSVYASYADIFRVQSNLKDSSGSALSPVKGVNYEAGIKGELNNGKLNASFAVFRIEETNRAILLSNTAIDGCCYDSGGKVRSQGFDAELTGELSPGWQLSAGYTFNTSKYLRDATSEGQPLRTMTPKHILRLWSSYRLPGDWNAWTIGGGLNVQSRIYNEARGIRGQQSGYSLASLMLGYRVSEHWSVALNVNNLFDKTYYTLPGASNGPANFGNVYGQPRNAMLTVRARF